MVEHLKNKLHKTKEDNYWTRVVYTLKEVLATKRDKKLCLFVPAEYTFPQKVQDLLDTTFVQDVTQATGELCEMSGRRSEDQDVHELEFCDFQNELDWTDKTTCDNFIEAYVKEDLTNHDCRFLLLLDQDHWNEWYTPQANTSLDDTFAKCFSPDYVKEWIRGVDAEFYGELNSSFPIKLDYYIEE